MRLPLEFPKIQTLGGVFWNPKFLEFPTQNSLAGGFLRKVWILIQLNFRFWGFEYYLDFDDFELKRGWPVWSRIWKTYSALGINTHVLQAKEVSVLRAVVQRLSLLPGMLTGGSACKITVRVQSHPTS